MKVKIKKLFPDVPTPAYATDGSGAFDIKAYILPNAEGERKPVDILFEKRKAFHTGLEFEIPKGYVMLLFSRSGHGFYFDTRLANCVGVIDSDYRGEVLVKLTQDFGHLEPKIMIRHGMSIAQGIILPY
jgi:dUTP pyrophosphatase